ncbi:AN1-type zinc finger protein, partial [Escherichia coli]
MSSCNLNDFLPIRCRCNALFCTDHITPDSHHCPVQQTTVAQGSDTGSFTLPRCAAQSCSKLSLEAFIANPEDTANRP